MRYEGAEGLISHFSFLISLIYFIAPEVSPRISCLEKIR
jgi:hypothetical protein